MKRQTSPAGVALGVIAAISLGLAASPALAEAAPSKIDAADTAWMISATGLVLMMTIPGLALFYAGMVRKKNVLATMAQSLVCTMLCSILWFAVGYSLSFVGDGPWLGTFERAFMRGTTMESVSPLAATIPEMLFMMYQMTFAIITVALVAGAVADRMRFSAFVWFAILWLLVVYVPVACRRRACSTSPAAPWCISTPASPAWSPPMWSATATATAATTSRPTTCRWP